MAGYSVFLSFYVKLDGQNRERNVAMEVSAFRKNV